MREAPQQVEMRPAALAAARPQPDVVGQQQRDAAFAFARQEQQRLVLRALHYGGAFGGTAVDEAEPAAPVRRGLLRALEPPPPPVAPAPPPGPGTKPAPRGGAPVAWR